MLSKWIAHATVDLNLSCFILVLQKEARRKSSMCDPFCKNPAFLARAVLTLLPPQLLPRSFFASLPNSPPLPLHVVAVANPSPLEWQWLWRGEKREAEQEGADDQTESQEKKETRGQWPLRLTSYGNDICWYQIWHYIRNQPK